VFGTRGNSGANEAGAEQAAALGAIREIEARNALTTLGITNVCSRRSGYGIAERIAVAGELDHGASLEQLVRLVRLTHPEVILTFLPGTFYWRRHGTIKLPACWRRSIRFGGRSRSFPSNWRARPNASNFS